MNFSSDEVRRKKIFLAIYVISEYSVDESFVRPVTISTEALSSELQNHCEEFPVTM